TAPTDHGALIPSAASNTLAVIPIPVSAPIQPKSYPLEFSESHLSKDEEPVEGLRTLEQLQMPDARMSFLAIREAGTVRKLTQKDRYELIAEFGLSAQVPEVIRVQFDTARNAYLYAWFVYRFHVVAEHQALATLELALRTRLTSAGVLDANGKYPVTVPPKAPGGPPRTERKKAMLRDLLRLAVDAGLLRNDRIENRQAWAMALARERQSFELSRKMFELGLAEMVVPDEDPVPTADELAFDWVAHYAETLPRVRNIHAHGSTMLHATVMRTFDVVRTFINQLFVALPAPP
ncbi:hypothetical protein, partial [Roseateles sp. LYH14W]